jgi:hypothetical protein
MGIINTIVKKGIEIKRRFDINQPKAYDLQVKVLRKLIEKARDTEFGKQYGFEEIFFSPNITETFAKQVPAGDYGYMMPWWEKARQGDKDVAWPGKVNYFALSSGTSEGASKYIPITADMLKNIKRTSARQLLSIARTNALPKDAMTKDSLIVGGSTDLEFNGINYCGDLSGITTSNLPLWFQPFSKPERDTRKLKNWQEKIDEMVRDAKKWDVGMVAGVPAWIQILFEKIIDYYKLENIHDIWPNFRIYIHGGHSFEPYKKAFEKLLGQPIYYFETYLASEGFMAFQATANAKGMRLQIKSGIYFEFVPFDSENFEDGNLRPNAQVQNLMEVELGKEYAPLISTCAGTWRYLIGDVIKFVDFKTLEVQITGRTKHFLSLCGEHLSVDNMTKALSLLSTELNVDMKEFTVCGERSENLFAHHWYIACDSPIDQEFVKTRLDELLKQLNDDYAVERLHALREVFVDVIPTGYFIQWMEKRGKLGSQNKFPRVMKGDLAEDWKAFVESQPVVVN